MTRSIFAMAFLLGAAAIGMMAMNFIDSDTLALSVTAVIGGVYAIGAMELLRYRRATSALVRALAALSDEVAGRIRVLDEWLIGVPVSLQQAVRQRIEGDRMALPAPVLTPYLVSLLVMLGLLGTFVGLVETLKGVVVALEGSSDLEAIRRALTLPMGGLGLAFGTSVAGVAASAMLGLMSTLSRRDRMLSTRQLDHKIATVLRRFSMAYQQHETLKALQVQSQGLPEIAAKLHALTDHLEQMSDRLGEQLVGGQNHFHEAVKTRYEALATSLDQSMQDSAARNNQMLAESSRLMVEGIQPVMQQAVTAIGDEIQRGVHTTHQQLSQRVQEQLQEVSSGFARTTEAVAAAWQKGIGEQQSLSSALIREMGASFALFREEFRRASADILASINRTGSDWAERQDAADTARLERWTTTLQQGQQQVAAQFEQRATTMITELNDVAAVQQRAIKAVSDDVASLSAEMLSQLQQSAEQTRQYQQQAMIALDDRVRSVVESAQADSTRVLTDMGRLLNSAEALVQARLDTEKGWVEAHGQRMQQLAEVLQQQLTGLRDEEAQRGSAAVARLAELESSVATHLSTLGRSLEAPMTRLIEVASETPRAAAEVIDHLRQQIAGTIERDNHLLEERARLMRELDALSGSLADASAGQLAAIEKLVDASAGRLNEITEQFSHQVVDGVSRVSEVADRFAISAVEMASLGEGFSTAVNLFGDANHRLIEQLHQIEGALDSTTERSDAQLGYYVAQAREVIDYSVLTQQALFDQLRQLTPGSSADSGDASGLN
jgi:hypothetical protein